MKKIWLYCGILCVFSGLSQGGELILAQDKKTDYTIINQADASTVDRFAAKELADFLQQITGAAFPISSNEAEVAGKKIYIGKVPAEKLAKLAEDDSVIEGKDGQLFLYGQGKYGNLYAVYELLENRIGCRFLNAYGDVYVPKIPELKIGDGKTSAHYSFPYRSLMMYFFKDKSTAALALYRNRQNLLLNPVGGGIENKSESFSGVHSLSTFIPGAQNGINNQALPHLKNKNYFSTNPEWFSMDENGNRVANRQVCFTNAELKKELTKNVLDWYEIRKKATGFNGVMEISCNDLAYNMCFCPDCQALQKQYKCEGAPLFLYLIELAKKYPEITFRTLAYQRGQTQHPPVLQKPFPKNISIIFAPINGDFSRPLNEGKLNKQDLDDFNQWCQLTNNILFWYYPNPYNYESGAKSFFIPPPVANLRRISTDIKLMAKNKIAGTYFEHDSGGILYGANFSELQSYVMLKLFQNADADLNVLIDDFMKHYYGAAAPLMRSYYNEIADADKAFSATSGVWNYNTMNYNYLTPQNLKKWNAIFEQALSKVDGFNAFNVRLNRLGLDSAIITTMENNEDMPLFEACAKRMRDTLNELAAKRQVNVPLDKFEVWLSEKAKRVPPKAIPAELSAIAPENIRVIIPDYAKAAPKNIIEDSDANLGKGLVEKFDGKTFTLGTYDWDTKKYGAGRKIFAESIKPGFNLYKFNHPMKITPKTSVFGDLWLIIISLGGVTSHDNLESLEQLWEIYASLKFTESQVICDRIILVKKHENNL